MTYNTSYNTNRVALKARMRRAQTSDAYKELCRFRAIVERALNGDLVLLDAHRRSDPCAFYQLSRGDTKSSANMARTVAEQVFCGLLLDGNESAADRYVDLSNAAINGEVDQHFTRSGFVYFLYDPRNATVKIGYSVDPRTRLSQLQTAEPYRRETLLVVAGTPSDEDMLHRRFAHLRTQGEWFTDCAELREYIEAARIPVQAGTE